MNLCCGECHIELNPEDDVIMDDFACVRHEKCYDFANKKHLVYKIEPLESVRGHFSPFLLNIYKEILAMDEEEARTAGEISNEEVIGALAYTLGYIE